MKQELRQTSVSSTYLCDHGVKTKLDERLWPSYKRSRTIQPSVEDSAEKKLKS